MNHQLDRHPPIPLEDLALPDAPDLGALLEAICLIRRQGITVRLIDPASPSVWQAPDGRPIVWPRPEQRSPLWFDTGDLNYLCVPGDPATADEDVRRNILRALAHVVLGHMCTCHATEPCWYIRSDHQIDEATTTAGQLEDRYPSLISQPANLTGSTANADADAA